MIGYDVRARLLDLELEAAAGKLSLQFFSRALEFIGLQSLGDDAVVDACLTTLERSLIAGKTLTESQQSLFEGSIRLLDKLWMLKGSDARSLALRCPLVASKKYIAKCTADYNSMMMAPVGAWPKTAKPFASVYSDKRVLHEGYNGNAASGLPDVVKPLIEWGIAHPEPLIIETLQRIEDERLSALADNPETARDVVVLNQEISEIALLSSELISRAMNDEESARALLGLLLCHVAPNDPRWRESILVIGRRKKSAVNVELSIRSSSWLHYVKSKNWIPVRGEGEKLSNVLATSDSLRPLLDLHPEWLLGNEAATELLIKLFEFDALDVRLLGVADVELKKKMRDSLAKLVEATGAHPELVEELAQRVVEAQERRAQIAWIQSFGLAVQEAVSQSLEAHGLRTRNEDNGYDYEVKLNFASPLTDEDDPGVEVEVGSSYLVEVKATRKREVHLTPKQARTASTEQQRYVLCVVDLRSAPAETLNHEWTAAEVEPYVRLVPGIGANVQSTWNHVAAARSGHVAIRHDEVLRYSVPDALWSNGISIDAWVATLAKVDAALSPPAPVSMASGGEAETPALEKDS